MNRVLITTAILLVTVLCAASVHAAPPKRPVKHAKGLDYKADAYLTLMLMNNLTFADLYGKDLVPRPAVEVFDLFAARCEELISDIARNKFLEADLLAAKTVFETVQGVGYLGAPNLKEKTLYEIYTMKPTAEVQNAFLQLKTITGEAVNAPKLIVLPTATFSSDQTKSADQFLMPFHKGGLGDQSLQRLFRLSPESSNGVDADVHVVALLAGRNSGILPEPYQLVKTSESEDSNDIVALDVDKCCKPPLYTCYSPATGQVCTQCPTGRCCYAISQFCI